VWRRVRSFNLFFVGSPSEGIGMAAPFSFREIALSGLRY
jgi:hypothetical protein